MSAGRLLHPQVLTTIGLKTFKEFNEKYYHPYTLTVDGKKLWNQEKMEKTPCPFLTDDKHCRLHRVRPDGIHSIKPEGCKCFPLFTDFGRSAAREIGCPGFARFEEIKKKALQGYTNWLTFGSWIRKSELKPCKKEFYEKIMKKLEPLNLSEKEKEHLKVVNRNRCKT